MSERVGRFIGNSEESAGNPAKANEKLVHFAFDCREISEVMFRNIKMQIHLSPTREINGAKAAAFGKLGSAISMHVGLSQSDVRLLLESRPRESIGL
jgi:hypothetical protein